MKLFSLLKKTRDIHELQAAATLVCDVTITTALVVTLGSKKSDNVQYVVMPLLLSSVADLCSCVALTDQIRFCRG
jgi:hypothetical protein